MRSIVEEALARVKDSDHMMDYAQNNEDLEEVLRELRTEIVVIGCGGGGSNTITRMMEEGIHGARLIAVNTDAQHLSRVQADQRILIGRQRTRGLGAGSLPQIGEEAALETEEEIRRAVSGADMVFITAGLGGGTGTGCAPSSRRRPARRVRSPSRSSPCPSRPRARSGWRTPRPASSACATSRTR